MKEEVTLQDRDADADADADAYLRRELCSDQRCDKVQDDRQSLCGDFAQHECKTFGEKLRRRLVGWLVGWRCVWVCK